MYGEDEEDDRGADVDRDWEYAEDNRDVGAPPRSPPDSHEHGGAGVAHVARYVNVGEAGCNEKLVTGTRFDVEAGSTVADDTGPLSRLTDSNIVPAYRPTSSAADMITSLEASKRRIKCDKCSAGDLTTRVMVAVNSKVQAERYGAAASEAAHER